MAKTTVSLGSNGQYKTTVPKGIAEAMELEGKKLEWVIDSSNRLGLKIIDE